MSGPGSRRQYPCRTCGAAIYSDGTYWRAVRDDTTHCASDSIGHLPDDYAPASPEGGVEVIVGIEESASYVEDMWPDEVEFIRSEAASKAVAEVLDRLEERVAIMKACAPDGDYIRWDVQHADVDLHYVNRSGVRALIASERER